MKNFCFLFIAALIAITAFRAIQIFTRTNIQGLSRLPGNGSNTCRQLYDGFA